ncbi:uncharacterized protein [Diadema setosum]|uniref:uncharacterized protein n=1 Tax=Diadema setosum TaxID=31175 RepID=UPI003B3B00CB
MRFFATVSTLAGVLACFHPALGQTSDCDAQCEQADFVEWDPVRNESAYNRDPNSLNDIENGRPLGFKHATLEYVDNHENPKSPCVTITGCHDRRVEIMVQTDPTAMICVSDVSTDVASRTTVCQEQIYKCGQCPSDTVTYQFSCQGQSCDQSDVEFWFRFVVSEDPAVLDPELWCDGRDIDQYPLSLISNVPIPVDPRTTPSPGRGSPLVSSLLGAILAPLLILIALH